MLEELQGGNVGPYQRSLLCSPLLSGPQPQPNHSKQRLERYQNDRSCSGKTRGCKFCLEMYRNWRHERLLHAGVPVPLLCVVYVDITLKRTAQNNRDIHSGRKIEREEPNTLVFGL